MLTISKQYLKKKKLNLSSDMEKKSIQKYWVKMFQKCQLSFSNSKHCHIYKRLNVID